MRPAYRPSKRQSTSGEWHRWERSPTCGSTTDQPTDWMISCGLEGSVSGARPYAASARASVVALCHVMSRVAGAGASEPVGCREHPLPFCARRAGSGGR